MTNEELVKDVFRRQGKADAEALQTNSVDMTDTEIVAQETVIPMFTNAVANKNMNEREIGFICQATDGNIWKLRQLYDSTIYTEEPEAYPSLWLLVITSNPEDAKPFVQSSEILYMTGNCCIGSDGVTYRSTIDNNTYDPTVVSQYWEVVEV